MESELLTDHVLHFNFKGIGLTTFHNVVRDWEIYMKKFI